MTYPKLTPILVPGTSTARYIGDRFAKEIDVKDFGAKGDGTTDDTEAFESALAYAESLAADFRSSSYSKPVTVYGRGTFVLSNTITVPNKNCINFDVESIIVNSWSGNSGDPVIHFKNANGINHFNLDCKHNSCCGVKVTGEFCFYEDINIFGFSDYGIDENGNVNRFHKVNIMQYHLGESITSQSQMNAVGMRVLGKDSWYEDVFIHRCRVCMQTAENTAGLNNFASCHFVGGLEPGVTVTPDVSLVEVYSKCYFTNCYFDTGHIDFYYPRGSIINGGCYYQWTSSVLSSTYPRVVRVFAYMPTGSNSVPNPQLQIQSIAIDIGFYSYDGNSFTNVPNEYPYSDNFTSDLNFNKHECYSTRVLGGVWNSKDIYTAGDYVECFHVGSDTAYDTIWASTGTRSIQPGVSGVLNVQGSSANSFLSKLRFNELKTGIGVRNGGNNLFLGSNNYDACVEVQSESNSFCPVTTAVTNLGKGDRLWKEIFSSTAAINTSDARIKENIAHVDDSILEAWGAVDFHVFQYKEAVGKKGDQARMHVGVVAQEIQSAFSEKGLDASRYGLFCYDKWEDEIEKEVVVDKKAVLDEEGNVIEEEVTHTVDHVVAPAGDLYSIRYTEALCLEAAYQRDRAAKAEARIDSLESRLSAIENSR